MTLLKSIYMLLLYGLCCIQTVWAYDQDSSKLRIGVLPVAFYTPETHIGFGTLCYTNFKLSRKDTLTRKSNTQSYLNYTLNHQILFQNDYTFFSTQNKYLLKGRLDLIRFPEFYFGLGNNTLTENKERIDFNYFLFSTGLYRFIQQKLYIGLLYQHHNLSMLDQTLLSYEEEREVYGDMGYRNSGLGIGVLIDRRNNPFNPQKGYYIELNGISYYDHQLKKQSFNHLLMDARWYKTWFKKITWNTNLYASLNYGNVPFRMMPAIGGPRFLRGYYQGRFRDHHMLIVQQEFRVPLIWRFGMAIFSGIGQVAEHTQDFALDRFHYHYGLGLRFKIDRKENAHVRLDYGFTQDSQGIYIVFAEAF